MQYRLSGLFFLRGDCGGVIVVKPCPSCPSQMPTVTVMPSFCASASGVSRLSEPQVRQEFAPAVLRSVF